MRRQVEGAANAENNLREAAYRKELVLGEDNAHRAQAPTLQQHRLRPVAVWLTVTGIASWWIRAPKRGWGIPPKVAMDWPRPLIAIAAIMCVVLPIFGASVVLVATIERLLRGRWRPA